MKKYELDPDYRISPKIDKPCCIRCQKELDPKNAIKVTQVDEWHVIKGGSQLIGKDCWKQITKE